MVGRKGNFSLVNFVNDRAILKISVGPNRVAVFGAVDITIKLSTVSTRMLEDKICELGILGSLRLEHRR